jgi:hypothetical protein
VQNIVAAYAHQLKRFDAIREQGQFQQHAFAFRERGEKTLRCAVPTDNIFSR